MPATTAIVPRPDAGSAPAGTFAADDSGTTVNCVEYVPSPDGSGVSTRWSDRSPTWIDATTDGAPCGLVIFTVNVTGAPECMRIGATVICGGAASEWWMASSSAVLLVISMYGVRSGCAAITSKFLALWSTA